jgi:PAS domain S-box-containing protein
MPPRSSTLAIAEPEAAALQPPYDQALDYAQLLRRLLGNLDGMVFRCRNDAHWTMEFVSDGCRQLTGYEPHDLVANLRTSYEQLIVAEDRVRVRESASTDAAAPERYALEYRIVRADGQTRTVNERGTAVRDAHGAAILPKSWRTAVTGGPSQPPDVTIFARA